MTAFSDYIKTAPQYLIPQQQLSIGFGLLASIKNPTIKNYFIRRFIKKYGVNMSEALFESPQHYATFNDFFIRKLKPDCRPISQADIICPVDGRISEIGRISQGQLLQAKNWYYSVENLLASHPDQAHVFLNGCFTTLYLSPKDYHRVHMPIDAMLTELTYIPGKLFSVQPTTVRVVPNIFSRNERLIAHFQTALGKMVMILVGATIVGTMGTAWNGDIQRKNQPYTIPLPKDIHFKQADEFGYFKLGSTVILLFENDISWHNKLQSGDAIQLGAHLGGNIY